MTSGALPTVNSMLNNGDDPFLIAGTALGIWGALSAVYWAAAWLVSPPACQQPYHAEQYFPRF
jgi:hypothetical protein